MAHVRRVAPFLVVVVWGWSGCVTGPSLAVTPSEGLTDGQMVAVTGAGFVRAEPREPYPAGVEVAQCAADMESWDDCDSSTVRFLQVDADKGFSDVHRVYSRIYPRGRNAIDCRIPGRCVLVASSDPTSLDEVASAPVAFDPDGPLLPLPGITVTPDEDLVDAQTVRVVGRGFDRASSWSARVYQCAAVPSEGTCPSVGAESVEVADDGTFSIDVQVFARLATPDAGEVDCRASAEACLLVASTESPDSPLAGRSVLSFDPGGSLLADPEVSVRPTAALGDFNTLSVEGRHFWPGVRASVQVCEAPPGGGCDGEDAEYPRPDADGEFSLEVTGWSEFLSGSEDGPAVDCRQAPGCVVVATDEARGLRATVPLSFGPPDPPRGRYLDPVFEEVDVDEGVSYRETTDYLGQPVVLTLDVYHPAGDTVTNRPAIVLMHGGWFASGRPADMASYAQEYARRGYVAVSLQYRLRPSAGSGNLSELYLAMRDAYEDASAGVEWLQAHASDYGVNPDAIVASGYSAGAVNATNLAYLPGQVGLAGSQIAAALPMSGWFVDPDTSGLPIPGPFARPEDGEPPAIVFHGTEDQILPIGSPADLCPLAHEADIACDYIGYEGAGHEVGVTRQRDIVRRGTEFLAEHVLESQGYFDE